MHLYYDNKTNLMFFLGSILFMIIFITFTYFDIGQRDGIYDIEDIAPHYSKTLLYWLQNFNKNESQIRKLGYDENFCRLWKYYLSYCAAGFQERYLGDLQILMNKSNISTY